DNIFFTLVWKAFHSIQLDILTAMLDWSLTYYTLPSLLKKVLAVIILNPNKLYYSIRKVYRMISLLPILSKVIEHVVLKSL
ncbi:hypothetical protein BGX38DRAFT_1079210, partial [Terfezia claveryi]